MAQATPTTAPATAPGALRVVLFGMPDAGKSSLLGALAQAAQAQEHVLNGRLIDKTQGLVELQRRVYEERPRETLAELAPFPVRLEPFPPRGQTANPPAVEAVLYDCDGRVANELLDRTRGEGLEGERTLAKAVLQADTLVLAVDASADAGVLKRDFGQFAHFLRLLERTRGKRTEIAGLPVYLVLTKCDLLAKQGDTANQWMDRIEDRKRQVDEGFQKFMAAQAQSENAPFGKVDLHLWATAVKRPALADAPARPREPYGVAELFRQALESAQDYRERRAASQGRLRLTVAILTGVLLLMGLLAALLFVNQPSEELTKLSRQVADLRSRWAQPAPQRLREPLGDRIAELAEVRNNPVYPRLTEEQRGAVEAAYSELTQYQEYSRRVNAIGETFGGQLKQVNDEKKLEEIRKALEEATPPRAHSQEWRGTEAFQQRERWRGELDALDKAVRNMRSAYEKLLTEARRLKTLHDKGNITVGDLRKEAAKLWEQVQALQTLTREGKEEVPGAGGLLYEHVFQFPSVAAVYQPWREGGWEARVKEWSR